MVTFYYKKRNLQHSSNKHERRILLPAKKGKLLTSTNYTYCTKLSSMSETLKTAKSGDNLCDTTTQNGNLISPFCEGRFYHANLEAENK